jgi:hypothetical protein
VNLTESTLAFGRAEEPRAEARACPLADVAEDVVENERLASDHADEACITIPARCPATCAARRSRTAAPRAVEPRAQRAPGHRGHGQARRDPHLGRGTRTSWLVHRGLRHRAGPAEKALDHLFKPFHGGARKGGTGLGLAIAAEMVRGHGGTLELVETGPDGTTFAICLPKGLAA